MIMNFPLTDFRHLRRLIGRWWLDEMREAYRSLMCALPFRPPPSLELTITKSGCRLATSFGEEAAAARIEDAQSRLLAIARSSRPRPLLSIALASEIALIRNLEVPVAATSEIENVLGLEIERATPFALNEIYHGWTASSRSSSGRISILHVIVKKATLEPWLEFLWSNGIDFTPIIKVLHVSGPINVRLFGKIFVIHPSHHKLRRIRTFAAAVAATALILLLTAVQWRQVLAAHEIDEALAITGKRAAAVRAKLADLEVFGRRATELQRRKFETVPVAGIWAELTKLMPDTAWLSELRIENSQIVISGFSKSSAELLGVLEASPLFEQATFTSPVSMARDSSVEQFSIRVKLAGQSPGEQHVSSVRQP